MHLALHTSLLGDGDPAALFDRAAAWGAAGVEVDAADLVNGQIEAIARAARASGVRVAGVQFARSGALLAADTPTREAALARLRAAIGAAVDLDAAGVVVVPHYGPYALPDLFPWKSPGELYAEMLHMHLRTLSDFCHALGTTLILQTAPPADTAFISRLEQADAVAARIKHPYVKISADLTALAEEAGDPADLLTRHARYLAYARTPIDRPAVGRTALRTLDGWLALHGPADEAATRAAIADLLAE